MVSSPMPISGSDGFSFSFYILFSEQQLHTQQIQRLTDVGWFLGVHCILGCIAGDACAAEA